MRLPDKQRTFAAVVAELGRTVAHVAEHARATREGATHEEAKPENDKDTRALEQSYLARGQASRVEELVEELEALRQLTPRAFGESDAVTAGALVVIEEGERERCVFLLPHGGGVKVCVDGVEVQVVTPRAPLGTALAGRMLGEDFELTLRGERREYCVTALS